jgi:hypothetical protein
VARSHEEGGREDVGAWVEALGLDGLDGGLPHRVAERTRHDSGDNADERRTGRRLGRTLLFVSDPYVCRLHRPVN